MAGTQGAHARRLAVVVYVAVHFIQGNLLTPTGSGGAVKLPPVLTIFAAVVFAILLGPVGGCPSSGTDHDCDARCHQRFLPGKCARRKARLAQ